MMIPQGDTRLLQDPTAQRLLASTELARVAYLAKDGTPRVIPMLFHWDGTELVLPTFAGSHKVASMRRHPAIAVTVDTKGPPPQVVQLRGRAEIVELDGVAPEYALAQRRYYGEEQGKAGTEQVIESGAVMTRIVLQPEWVGVLDFESRFPGALVASGLADEDGS
jgi:PPOX class probable F420-dependent enzyme